jgi:16S rRNA (uracil1498-N3)-methyltransferase
MPEHRFYIDHPLEPGLQVSLDPKETHHLTVMRTSVGHTVELINGKNVLAVATVLSLHKKQALLLIQEVIPGKQRVRECILCQAICEFSRLDLIVEKTTELGVSEIWLFPAEKNMKQEISSHQQERMQALLISAIKQCGRLDIPTLQLKPRLTEFPSLDAPAFFGDLHPEAPLFLSCITDAKKLYFFIGPPSGFSQQEEEALLKLKARGVSLNQNILRTETAALCAVSLSMHLTINA